LRLLEASWLFSAIKVATEITFGLNAAEVEKHVYSAIAPQALLAEVANQFE